MENSPLLRLFFDVKSKPVAAHKPADVPLHWDARVKAGLDQGVRLGVIGPEGMPILVWGRRKCPPTKMEST